MSDKETNVFTTCLLTLSNFKCPEDFAQNGWGDMAQVFFSAKLLYEIKNIESPPNLCHFMTTGVTVMFYTDIKIVGLVKNVKFNVQ
jgi:hypothetical protein